MKICLRKKMINRMTNRLCTHNIMKIKMILTTITHKWLMIFHRKKVAMFKMKRQNNTTMALTTMITITLVMRPTLKTKMRTNIPKAISTTNKVFTMKSDKTTAQVRKSETNNKLSMNTMTKITNQSTSRKDIWMKL